MSTDRTSLDGHRYEKPEVVPIRPFAHPTSQTPPEPERDGDGAPGIAPEPQTPDDPGPSTPREDTDGEPEPDDGPATAGRATTVP